MKQKYIFFLLLILFAAPAINKIIAQDDEPIIYFQVEPLDDSLFIHIQEALFIDPPGP
jgi:hypothetical protein